MAIVAIWSMVFLWQSDMNAGQCQAYLWLGASPNPNPSHTPPPLNARPALSFSRGRTLTPSLSLSLALSLTPALSLSLSLSLTPALPLRALSLSLTPSLPLRALSPLGHTVYLPISFVIQMMNMKAYRLSVFLHSEDKHRLRRLTHTRMLLLSLAWVLLTAIVLVIVVCADTPKLVLTVVDPYRPSLNYYNCNVGRVGTHAAPFHFCALIPAPALALLSWHSRSQPPHSPPPSPPSRPSPPHGAGNGLLYALVIGHAVFSIGCVISVRNGDGAFRDGMVMKEAFVIFWFCLIIAFIMGQLGASDPF